MPTRPQKSTVIDVYILFFFVVFFSSNNADNTPSRH